MADKGQGAARKKSLRGKQLGRYKLVDHIADGGMAEIFLARLEGDSGFTKELVLKVLQERLVSNPEMVSMFIEEARLGALLRHPSIVDVLEIGQEDNLYFIAMEYIEGHTLRASVTRGLQVADPLPLPYAAYITQQVAEGLAYLQGGVPGHGHANIPPVVHRDISPTNLILSWSGQTKIIDFGIAQRGEGKANPTGGRPGKISYMSPEQVRGAALDGRSDIFSLGTVLYEITLGKRLWRGPQETVMQRIVEEKPVPPTYVRRDYPPALERIVLRALEKRPQDRYATAADMALDLEAYLAAEEDRPGNRHIAAWLERIYASHPRPHDEAGVRDFAAPEDTANDEQQPLDFDRPRTEAPGAGLARALRDAEPFELASALTGVAPTTSPAQSATQPAARDVSSSALPAVAHHAPVAPALTPRTAIASPPSASRFGWLVGILLAIALLGGVLYLFKGR